MSFLTTTFQSLAREDDVCWLFSKNCRAYKFVCDTMRSNNSSVRNTSTYSLTVCNGAMVGPWIPVNGGMMGVNGAVAQSTQSLVGMVGVHRAPPRVRTRPLLARVAGCGSSSSSLDELDESIEMSLSVSLETICSSSSICCKAMLALQEQNKLPMT